MESETKFQVEVKAEKLYFRIFDLTTCRQHYPVRFRRLSDRMQEYALLIHSDIVEANSLIGDTNKYHRYELQTRAITNCNKLFSLIKYSLHSNLISAAVAEELSKVLQDVKYMTLAWRKN